MKEDINLLTDRIIGAGIAVHRFLGPGLLETVYRRCLAAELRHDGFGVEEEVALPVVYRELRLECGYRMDLVVDDQVVVEVKTVKRLAPVHTSQVLTYLRLSHKHVGLLLNFSERFLKHGLKRVVLGGEIEKPSAFSALPRSPRQSF